MVFVGVLVAGFGCASQTQDLEIRELSRKVEAMQQRMVQYDVQVESLSNTLIVLKARHGREEVRVSAPAPEVVEGEEEGSNGVDLPGDLPVVRLVPTQSIEASPVGGGEVARVGGEPLRVSVAKVPPPPQLSSIDEDAADLLFTDGLGAYQKGEYKDAIRFFMEFDKAYQSHSRAVDSLYWLASCHFESREYGQSISHYERYLQRFPHGKKVPEVLLHVGLAYEKLHALNEAELVFERLVRDFPASAITEIARTHLEESRGRKR